MYSPKANVRIASISTRLHNWSKVRKINTQREVELGYPHELILFALSRSKSVIEGRYRSRVKLLANLLRTSSGEEPAQIRVLDKSDVPTRVLDSLSNKSSDSVRTASEDYRARLHQLIEESRTRQSSPSFSALVNFASDGVLLHILLKETKKVSLFLEEDIVDALKAIDERDGNLKAILEAISLWNASTCDVVSGDIISELASSKKDLLLETAIFLSYVLAMRCPKSKHELLVVHYQLVRKVVSELNEIFSQENLSDELFERIFRVAVVLSCCGYLKSIRLPHEEKIRYIDEIIKSPSIEQVFGEVFDDASNIPLPRTEEKAPLWMLALLSVILMVLHWVSGIYLPLVFSLSGFQFTLPALPVFLVLALVFSSITFLRLLYLKKHIMKRVRTGATDE